MPLLFLLVLGLFEFGRLVMVQQSLTNGAREGCRKAILATTGSSQDAEAAVRSHLQAAIPAASDVDKVRVSVSPSSFSEISRGDTITVAVEVNSSDVSLLSSGFLGFLGDPVLSARAVQQRE